MVEIECIESKCHKGGCIQYGTYDEDGKTPCNELKRFGPKKDAVSPEAKAKKEINILQAKLAASQADLEAIKSRGAVEVPVAPAPVPAPVLQPKIPKASKLKKKGKK